MSLSTVVRNIGPTYALSVGATSTAALQVSPVTYEMGVYLSFLNTGATTVAINMAPNGVAGAAVFPVPGSPQQTIILPPLMTQPTIYAAPQSASITAIGSGAGPGTVYITPVSAQS